MQAQNTGADWWKFEAAGQTISQSSVTPANLAYIVGKSASDCRSWSYPLYTCRGLVYFDGSTLRLFMDGVEVGTGCARFNGKIDEVCIWNQALNPAVVSKAAINSCNYT